MTDTTTEDLLTELMGLADALSIERTKRMDGTGNVQRVANARSTLESRLRAVVEDAQRYRWLRGRPYGWSVEHVQSTGWVTCYGCNELDTAIDRARKGGEPS